MAIRDIVWTVSEDAASITPSTIQNGGVQGEHNATRAIFQIGESSPLANPEYTLYVECTDSTGGEPDHQGPLTIENGQVSVLLPLAWTQYGGVSTMRLVAEKTADQSEKVIMLECRVRFDTRPEGPKGDGVMRGFMQTMLNETVEAKDAAEEAAQNAEAAASDAFLNRDAAAESALEARGLAADALLNAQRAQNAAEEAAGYVRESGAAASSARTAAGAAEDYMKAAEAAAAAAEKAAEIPIDEVLRVDSSNPIANSAVAKEVGGLKLSDQALAERMTAIEKDLDTVDELANSANELGATVAEVSTSMASLSTWVTDLADNVEEQSKQIEDVSSAVGKKQDELVSGQNIKTINGKSVLGDGNIDTSIPVDEVLDANSTNPVQNKAVSAAVADINNNISTLGANVSMISARVGTKQDTLVSGTNIKTVNGQSLLGSGDITIEGGGGGSITVDDAFNPESTNPVQNKVITAALGEAQTAMASMQAAITNIPTTVETYVEQYISDALGGEY